MVGGIAIVESATSSVDAGLGGSDADEGSVDDAVESAGLVGGVGGGGAIGGGISGGTDSPRSGGRDADISPPGERRPVLPSRSLASRASKSWEPRVATFRRARGYWR